jgi:phospholipase C
MVPKSPIEHVVLIIKENHSFDNYFGTFPGANGTQLARSPNPPSVSRGPWFWADSGLRVSYALPDFFHYPIRSR